VQLGPQVVRLRPAPHTRTPVLAYSMRVTPEKHFVNWQQDPQSNYLARIVVPEKTREFEIQVDLVAEMSVINPFDFFLEPSADRFPFRYDVAQVRELGPYLVKMQPTPLFEDYLESIPRRASNPVDFLVELNRQLAKDIRYLIRMEAGGPRRRRKRCKNASGSCRDSSWLLVQLLRHLGLRGAIRVRLPGASSRRT
jgi:transglutaminase-like putative cysteine protease